jgi:putative endonuclease
MPAHRNPAGIWLHGNPFTRHPGASRDPVLSSIKQPCTYILASRWNGTLYVGVTSDLVKRVWEHKHDVAGGFTRKYRVHDLVWFEQHATMELAIAREKSIKEWKRAWKIQLIEQTNPKWVDLYPDIIDR